MATQTHLPTLRINGTELTAQPRETLLQAAERGGIEFPNSCRVGGCGTCKCKVTSGEVRELTESGYLLSAAELAEGYVLACQSVPKSDVTVEVDLEGATARGVAGTIVAQEKLTHDITQLTIELSEPLPYKAGQFANLTIEGLDGVVRSYSFAAPSHRSGRVQFMIRKVPGGLMSSLVNDEDVVGRGVHVDGPSGEFYLRAGRAPLLFVAGGSGLAPILAVLEEAITAGVERPATLLFGARTRDDLYALEQIASIGERWKGEFRFVPVLSDAADDAAWEGEKGLVTEQIPALLQAGSQAYLCGPPAMIDHAIPLLREQGVRRADIHFDRFTTRADAADASAVVPEQADTNAGILHYLKFFAFHFIGLLAVLAIFGGGQMATPGLLFVVVLYMLGDAVLGDDASTPHFTQPKVLTVQLWLALPLLAAIVFASVWSFAPGDPLGVGALIEQYIGYPVLAAREATSLGGHVSILVLTGLMIGMVGTITGHELTHRTWDPISMLVGRWLLAFSFDTNFAIEHVYGHHRYVSTEHDPATAPRGRNVYFHIVASTFRGNVSAWRIEVDRLRKKGLPVYSHHNAVIRGQLMSVALLCAAYAMGGLITLAWFIVAGAFGKSLLEIVNYMEHYGMVRDPATAVQPRHSWNTNRRISSWTMFNLTRHSHHHAQGEVPYHELRPYPDAPMMINGYLTTIITALIPPLWHHLMTPKVLEWDRDYASADELLLAERANEKSGISALNQGARHDALA